jgi:phage baseplate assembly protein W
LGECKFDETFGTEIWEMDFDLLKSDNTLKEFIVSSMKKSIAMHEKRLLLEDVEVSVRDHNLGRIGKSRMKKRVIISVKGQVLETNRPFLFQNFFFVGPLSY